MSLSGLQHNPFSWEYSCLDLSLGKHYHVIIDCLFSGVSSRAGDQQEFDKAERLGRISMKTSITGIVLTVLLVAILVIIRLS